jgi:chromosomal replication initiator protein
VPREELEQIWSQVQAALRRTLPTSTYSVWLEPLQPRELSGRALVVVAPVEIRAWVADRFKPLLDRCAAAVLGDDINVEVVSIDTPGGVPHKRADVLVGPSAPAAEIAFNPKLTFEQFVIGDSNRLAHAGALAVAEMPSQAYNPLFICGPPGLGKTHLLHSIANYVTTYAPGMTVRYTTVESFTNEFLRALQSGSVESFKRRFRHTDVLLIDDVQFLERKAKTEEEFFHTINALQDIGGQLVLTSDRLPADLAALEERLRERFEAGLVADVSAPDSPTRLTILRKRVAHDSIDLSDTAALEVIAARVTANIRALEGALIRVVAFASLTHRPITVDLAGEVLDVLYPPKIRPRRSLAEVQRIVCETFRVSQDELIGTSRAVRIAWPRQVAMYLARELTDQSLPSIGRAFGNRDHTTVMHACKRITQRMTRDPRTVETIRSLTDRLTVS